MAARTPAHEVARNALLSEITRQTKELGDTVPKGEQAKAVKHLADAYSSLTVWEAEETEESED